MYKCIECGISVAEDEVEFCPHCDGPLCPDCYAEHEESCEQPD